MTEATEPPPPLPPPVPTRSRAHTTWAWVLSGVGVLLVVVVVAGFFVHLPYVIISPGSVTPLDSSVVQITGAPTYPHGASVLFLTVRVTTHDPSLWRLATAWLDSDQDVEKRSTVVGCLSDTENQEFNTQLMDQSQNDAKYVALTRLGYEVPADPPEFRVVQVCRGVPAYGKLQVGDQILDVDGHPVTAAADIAPLVQSHHPGDPVTVTYARGAAKDSTTIVAGKLRGEGTANAACVPVHRRERGTPCLGITSEGFVSYQFPINVQIDTYRVGGPSAGLAFTLAIIDDLTPGALTGGKRVAITGTIAPDGSVGEVGGVEQKAITARTNGVQLMIVPKPEVEDARRGAGGVRVVGVSTVDEALAALEAAGGAPVHPVVPPPSSTAARS